MRKETVEAKAKGGSGKQKAASKTRGGRLVQVGVQEWSRSGLRGEGTDRASLVPERGMNVLGVSVEAGRRLISLSSATGHR